MTVFINKDGVSSYTREHIGVVYYYMHVVKNILDWYPDHMEYDVYAGHKIWKMAPIVDSCQE